MQDQPGRQQTGDDRHRLPRPQRHVRPAPTARSPPATTRAPGRPSTGSTGSSPAGSTACRSSPTAPPEPTVTDNPPLLAPLPRLGQLQRRPRLGHQRQVGAVQGRTALQLLRPVLAVQGAEGGSRRRDAGRRGQVPAEVRHQRHAAALQRRPERRRPALPLRPARAGRPTPRPTPPSSASATPASRSTCRRNCT